VCRQRLHAYSPSEFLLGLLDGFGATLHAVQVMRIIHWPDDVAVPRALVSGEHDAAHVDGQRAT
jgi:hypothetical protein